MVNIDTVYQRVLALANKEQRGYITPQEFNLFANQAQAEIFEQYFYDLNQFQRIHGNDTPFANIDNILEEKLQIFQRLETSAAINSWAGTLDFKIIPDYIYRIIRIEFNNVNCEIHNTFDFNELRDSGPLLAPSNERPIANIRENRMRVVGSNNSFITPTGVFYFIQPETVSWGYFVVGSKALYDANSPSTVHFQLHAAEETELIYKILKYAGVSMKRNDIMTAGQGLEMTQVQQEKQ